MTDERHDENGRTRATERIVERLLGNGRPRPAVALVSITLTALGALGGFGLLAMDAGAQKQRIDTIEKRQIEDRTNTGEKVNRVEQKVEKIADNVTIILQELRDMQAEQRVERRNRDRRSQ